MFSDSTLNLLPNTTLAAASNGLAAKASGLATSLSAKTNRMQRLAGTNVVSNTTQGRTDVTLVNSKTSSEKLAEQVTGAASVASLAQTLTDGGLPAYDATSLPPGTTGSADEIATMGAELSEQALLSQRNSEISSAVAIQQQVLLGDIESTRAALDATKETLGQVNSIIEKRAKGELPNPKLNYEDVPEALDNILTEMTAAGVSAESILLARDAMEKASSRDLTSFDEYVANRIVAPYVENAAALDIMMAQLQDAPVDPEKEPIFDTVFEAPQSTAGRFVLSKDGIYYDSRTGSIPYIAAHKIDSASWQLRYASNSGGKGEMYGEALNSRLAETIFSEQYKNESGQVLAFYKYDDILRGFENDKNLQIMDVSAKITDLLASGYDTSSAIIQNYEESYAGVGYTYDRKIVKRKKQLQIAALFGTFGVTTTSHSLGAGVFYKHGASTENPILTPSCGGPLPTDTGEVGYTGLGNVGIDINSADREDRVEYIDRIPINDFSYLKDISLIPTYLAQNSLMLHSSDLDHTTSPITPVYLTQGASPVPQTFPEVNVAPMGVTDWVNTSGDTDLTGTIPYLRTLDDSIVRDGLVVCYNFLEPSAVVPPMGTLYGVRNYSETGVALDAKMVGAAASSIFTSGVTVPYLTGSVYNTGKKFGIRYSYISPGQYVRLPNNYKDNEPNVASRRLDSVMYSKSGWALDFWVHAPDLSSGMSVDHRYKLVLANENCGTPTANTSNSQPITADPGSDDYSQDRSRTRGMVVGFRDRGAPGTPEASGLEFVVLTTVSQNDPLWGKSVCITESVTGQGTGTECRSELGFKVPISASSDSGYTVGDCSASFTHYNVVCNTDKNEMVLYVNGESIATSSVSTAFNNKPGAPLNVPTKITEGHYHDPLNANGESLYRGDFPSYPIFTPWIIGGGWTDGVSHEVPAVFATTFPGFLGTNTNSSYFSTTGLDFGGGPFGQHSNTNVAGLGGYALAGTNYKLARSGLDGHVGSFKIYDKPLTTKEVSMNYEAQSPFFGGIKIPERLL